jgi:hypothetical protein
MSHIVTLVVHDVYSTLKRRARARRDPDRISTNISTDLVLSPNLHINLNTLSAKSALLNQKDQ